MIVQEEFSTEVVESEIRTLYMRAHSGYPPLTSWWRKWERFTVAQKQTVWTNFLAKIKMKDKE